MYGLVTMLNKYSGYFVSVSGLTVLYIYVYNNIPLHEKTFLKQFYPSNANALEISANAILPAIPATVKTQKIVKKYLP